MDGVKGVFERGLDLYDLSISQIPAGLYMLGNVQQDESSQDYYINMRNHQHGPLIFNLSPLKM